MSKAADVIKSMNELFGFGASKSFGIGYGDYSGNILRSGDKVVGIEGAGKGNTGVVKGISKTKKGNVVVQFTGGSGLADLPAKSVEQAAYNQHRMQRDKSSSKSW